MAIQLADDADIIESVGLDSLEMLQFMLEVEERLLIKIDFNILEFEHLKSIKILAEFLRILPGSLKPEICSRFWMRIVIHYLKLAMPMRVSPAAR